LLRIYKIQILKSSKFKRLQEFAIVLNFLSVCIVEGILTNYFNKCTILVRLWCSRSL